MKKSLQKFLGVVLVGLMALAIVPSVNAASQYFYLTDYTTGIPSGADYQMNRSSGHGISSVLVAIGTPVIWVSNESASGDINFGTGTWNVHLDYTDCASGGYLEETETITIEIGYFDTSFHSVKTTIDTGYGSGCSTGKSSTHVTLTPDTDFIVPNNAYVALKLSMSPEMVLIDVDGAGDAASWVYSPPEDPGYPIPEFSTLLIPIVGMIALFAVFRKYKKK